MHSLLIYPVEEIFDPFLPLINQWRILPSLFILMWFHVYLWSLHGEDPRGSIGEFLDRNQAGCTNFPSFLWVPLNMWSTEHEEEATWFLSSLPEVGGRFIYLVTLVLVTSPLWISLHNLYSYASHITSVIGCCLHQPVFWGTDCVMLLSCTFRAYGGPFRLLFDYNCASCVGLLLILCSSGCHWCILRLVDFHRKLL